MKYSREEIRKIIDDFWRENHYPPSLRDIMQVSGIKSTFSCRYIVRSLPDIRITKNGHPIPKWVDQLFKEKQNA